MTPHPPVEPALERLLRDRPPERALQWVVDTVDDRCRVVDVTPLYGGVSHATHRVDLEGRSGPWSLVLRRWVRLDWREDNADHSAGHEAATLRLLAGGGVRAPRLVGVDDCAALADVPAVLQTLVPGNTPHITTQTLDVMTGELARAIVAVHALRGISAKAAAVPYTRYHAQDELDMPATAMAGRNRQLRLERFLGSAIHSLRA